jgi:hypothetical protein
VSLVCFTAALFGLSFVSNAATPAWLYILVIFCNGLATGALLNYTLAHILHLSAPENHFISASLLGTFRGFAGSFGTAIGGGIFSRTLRDALTEGFENLKDGLTPARQELIPKLIGGPALVFGGTLSDAERDVAIHGYEVSLSLLYKSAAALCILVLLVQAGTGWTAPLSEAEEEVIAEEISEQDETLAA